MALQLLLFVGYAILNTGAMAATKSVVRSLSAGGRIAALGYLAVGGTLYAAALTLLLVLLKGSAASTVYPVAIGATVLASNAFGIRFYGERITSHKVLGTCLVVAGVALTYIDWSWS